MHTITSHIELAILNELLLKVKTTGGSFKMAELASQISGFPYSNHELSYKNVRDFLLYNSFAFYVNEKEDTESLALFDRGKYLAAYGSIDNFNFVLDTKINGEELEQRVNKLISNISPYAEFILVAPPRKKPPFRVHNINPFSDDAPNMAKVLDSVINREPEYRDILREELMELVKDERAAIYLIDNGFASNRHDIKAENQIYRQLTDTGRKLKELGSISEFKHYQEELKEEKENAINHAQLEQQRNKYMFWITICIAISTAMQGISNFLETIRNYYNRGIWVTVYILVPFATIAFLFYISNIVRKQLLASKKRKRLQA